MEPLLRAWFAVVDRLLPSYALSPLGDGARAPGWRVELYGGDGVGRAREVPVRAQVEVDDLLRASEQRCLREAFELFALALRIDDAAFMAALARGMPWITTAWSYEPFAAADKAFKDTKHKLLALGGLADDTTADLELLLRLEVVPGAHKPAKLTEMLRRIDREVFVVSKILVVLSPETEPATLPDFLNVLHGFRDTAAVDVHVDVPVASQDATKLGRWKWFFDLAARKAYGDIDENDAKSWTVTAVLGEPPSLGRRGGLASAATTTASITMALQDAGSARHVRAKYLGYLLRTGRVQTLGVRDQSLTAQDVDHMLSVWRTDTAHACLRALYEPMWRGRKMRLLDDKHAKKFLANASEVVGAMHDLAESDTSETVDVFLAGYGQCGIKRALLPAVRAMVEATSMRPTLAQTQLTSLDLLFLSGNDTVPSVVRLVSSGVGRALEKLQLEIERGAYTLRQLSAVLETCPALRKCIVKPLRIGGQDDALVFAPPAPRHPLQSLTMSSYTAELKEFGMFAEQRVVAHGDYVAPVHAFFTQRLPVLRKMRIVGFASGYLRGLWSRRRESLRAIGVLMLESVSWDDDDWTDFTHALADMTHPLAQSLHTLHLKLTGWEDLSKLQPALDANGRPVNIAIDVKQGFGDRAEFMQRTQATNGRKVCHVKDKLTVRHKAAFLSAIAKANMPLASQNIQAIFDYAAATETRYVRVNLVATQQAPLF